MLENYSPSKSESIIHAAALGLILALVALFFTKDIAPIIATFSLGFTLWSKVADWKRIDFLSSEVTGLKLEAKKTRKVTHGEYTRTKIKELRKLLIGKKVSKLTVISRLSEIENMLNEMYKCCSEGEEKEAFKQKKGIVGNFKTQVEISSEIEEMKEKYKDFIHKLQEIQVFIEEL